VTTQRSSFQPFAPLNPSGQNLSHRFNTTSPWDITRPLPLRKAKAFPPSLQIPIVTVFLSFFLEPPLSFSSSASSLDVSHHRNTFTPTIAVQFNLPRYPSHTFPTTIRGEERRVSSLWLVRAYHAVPLSTVTVCMTSVRLCEYRVIGQKKTSKSTNKLFFSVQRRERRAVDSICSTWTMPHTRDKKHIQREKKRRQ